jgi:MFS family permease
MGQNSKQPTGMVAFTIVWLGQMVSMLGTGMTRFAITIWAWQTTGEATTLALVGLFSYGPAVLLSPVAGALVDRWPRKIAMMVSDLAAGVSTVAIFCSLALVTLKFGTSTWPEPWPEPLSLFSSRLIRQPLRPCCLKASIPEPMAC